MSISSRFAVGIHILTLLDTNEKQLNTSEFMAGSIQKNPALIRKITGMLKNAGLINVRPGVAGASLAKDRREITLLDIYEAVSDSDKKKLFSIHEHPNPECRVGRNIQSAIVPVFESAERAMEKELSKTTLADIADSVLEAETNKMK